MLRRWHLSNLVGHEERALLIPGRKRVLGIGNRKFHDPGEELSLACLKNSKKASWAGMEKGKGRDQQAIWSERQLGLSVGIYCILYFILCEMGNHRRAGC